MKLGDVSQQYIAKNDNQKKFKATLVKQFLLSVEAYLEL